MGMFSYLKENERPNCAVAHLSDLLISVSFKIDDDTLEYCLYGPHGHN